ncbi:hypothetical protein [Phaeocystidibacter luteus]|uniref:Uncharacterized protein n=1 Tax=Phaeocystidibacter luteus TaxID=911197 RepID=A0A6N6RGJ9_9FLAO|nr:hypothetical protein [Phaeocystidibacter luteus]KAB2807693.1 hypothetical protein F8C67_11675 [Phaeocystidibacter luteus]
MRLPGTYGENSFVVTETPSRSTQPVPGNYIYFFNEYDQETGGYGDGPVLNITYSHRIVEHVYLRFGLRQLISWNNQATPYYPGYFYRREWISPVNGGIHVNASTRETEVYSYDLWFTSLYVGLGAELPLGSREKYALRFSSDVHVGMGVMNKEVHSWVPQEGNELLATTSLSATRYPNERAISKLSVGFDNKISLARYLKNGSSIGLGVSVYFQSFNTQKTTYSNADESFTDEYSPVRGQYGFYLGPRPLNSLGFFVNYSILL